MNSRRSSPARKPTRRGANRVHRLHRKRALRRARWSGLGKNLSRKLFFLATTFALACAVAAGGWQGWRAYREGRILTVNRIDVAGNSLWESSRLLEAARLDVGARVPELSMKFIRDAIRQLPGIQGVNVRRSLSGDVSVEVQESGILALRSTVGSDSRRSRSWSGLTASGAWIPLSPSGAKADAPVVEGTGSVDGTTLACFLAGARERYPDLFGSFSQIAPRGRGEADIYWRDGRFKARVDYANKSLNSLEFLRALLRSESAAWHPGSTVDLRVEGYAYVL